MAPRAALMMVLGGALAGCAATGTPTSAPPADPAAQHVARAFSLAGDDLRAEAQALCPQPPAPPASGSYHDRAHPPIPPTRVFDDLDFIGHEGVGATVLRTSAGLILIDSLTTDAEVAEVLLPGLAALGHDPADIAYLVITHGHGDHHGGVQALRRINPAIRVVMSEADWAFSAQPFYLRDGSLDPAPRPERQPQDIGFAGTMRLTLGETTLELVETPGHTGGTVSLLYPVHWRGERLMAMQWGGGNPTQPVFTPQAVQGFMDRARAADVRVRWSSHAQGADLPRLAALRAGTGSGTGAHPFIASAAQFDRWIAIMSACKAAKAALAD